jgi:hypothetical protein
MLRLLDMGVARSTWLALLVAAALALVSSRARAADPDDEDERPPSNGVALLVTGGILTGVGGLSALTSAIFCPLIGVDQEIGGVFTGQKENTTPCYVALISAGAAFVIAGIPLIAVGSVKRSAYVEWRRDHHPIVERISVVPTRGGLALGWRTEF